MSRLRIVEAADDARRQIERDLHDGAQQQLVSLALDLRMLKARLGDSGLTAAVDEINEKLATCSGRAARVRAGDPPGVPVRARRGRGGRGAGGALAAELRGVGGSGRAAARAGRGGGVLRDRRGADERGPLRRYAQLHGQRDPAGRRGARRGHRRRPRRRRDRGRNGAARADGSLERARRADGGHEPARSRERAWRRTSRSSRARWWPRRRWTRARGRCTRSRARPRGSSRRLPPPARASSRRRRSHRREVVDRRLRRCSSLAGCGRVTSVQEKDVVVGRADAAATRRLGQRRRARPADRARPDRLRHARPGFRSVLDGGQARA